MSARSFALAFTLPIVTAAAVSPPREAPAQGPATVCTCNDLTTLINRLNMAQMAVDFFNNQIGPITNAQQKEGKEFLMDHRNASGQTHYEWIVESLNEAMGTVQMQGVKTGGGKTDAKCNVTIEPDGTPCLDEVIRAHEHDVHAAACNAEKQAGKFNFLGNRPVPPLLVYIKEEIRGYEREIAKIREILKGLPPECEVDWVGYINFYEANSMGTSETLGPLNSRVSSAKKTTSDFTRGARFLIRASSAPLMNVRAGLIGELSSTDVGRTHCNAGLAGAKGVERMIHTTSSTKTEIAGFTEGDGNASFSFDATTGKYSVSAGVPDSKASGTMTYSYKVRGSCLAAYDVTQNSSSSVGDTFAGTSASHDDSTSATSTRVGGEKKFDWSPRTMPPGVTSSHTGRLHWMLHRIK